MLRRQQRQSAGGQIAQNIAHEGPFEGCCTSPTTNDHTQHSHQFVNPITTSTLSSPSADIDLGRIHFASAAALTSNSNTTPMSTRPLPTLPSLIVSSTFHPLSSPIITTTTTTETVHQTTSGDYQESCFEVGLNGLSTKRKKKKSSSLICSTSTAGGSGGSELAQTSTTFGVLPPSFSSNGTSSVVSSTSTAVSVSPETLTIELEPIAPLTNFDCDSQPLIR